MEEKQKDPGQDPGQEPGQEPGQLDLGQEQSRRLSVKLENFDKNKKRKTSDKLHPDQKPDDKPNQKTESTLTTLDYAETLAENPEITFSRVKRGLASPPFSPEALQSWYDHYTYGLCGTNSSMRFTVILDGVDSAFPNQRSSFWTKWIPIVQGVVENCPYPFGNKLTVRYLKRHEGGFEFVCKDQYALDQYMWQEWIFPDVEVGKNPERVEIRVDNHERIGSASLITFAAQRNCPLVVMMGFLKACVGLAKVVEIENMPGWDDPIWKTHSLFNLF